jgi:hypothetical protein
MKRQNGAAEAAADNGDIAEVTPLSLASIRHAITLRIKTRVSYPS